MNENNSSSHWLKGKILQFLKLCNLVSQY